MPGNCSFRKLGQLSCVIVNVHWVKSLRRAGINMDEGVLYLTTVTKTEVRYSIWCREVPTTTIVQIAATVPTTVCQGTRAMTINTA